jgi:hypothetical protein
MIAGPKIAYDMFVSMLFGWAFLSWLSRKRGWVSGHPGDWKRGVRGWIIWPGLAALLADCIVSILGSIIVKSTHPGALDKRKADQRRDRPTHDSEESPDAVRKTGSYFWERAMKFMTTMLSPTAIGLGLVVNVLLGPFLIKVAFGSPLTWVEVFGAFMLAFPLSYMAIRATGRTDTTPASALGRLSACVAATNRVLTLNQPRSRKLSLHCLQTRTITCMPS